MYLQLCTVCPIQYANYKSRFITLNAGDRHSSRTKSKGLSSLAFDRNVIFMHPKLRDDMFEILLRKMQPIGITIVDRAGFRVNEKGITNMICTSLWALAIWRRMPASTTLLAVVNNV